MVGHWLNPPTFKIGQQVYDHAGGLPGGKRTGPIWLWAWSDSRASPSCIGSLPNPRKTGARKRVETRSASGGGLLSATLALHLSTARALPKRQTAEAFTLCYVGYQIHRQTYELVGCIDVTVPNTQYHRLSAMLARCFGYWNY
jgi:hypothetical protein